MTMVIAIVAFVGRTAGRILLAQDWSSINLFTFTPHITHASNNKKHLPNVFLSMARRKSKSVERWSMCPALHDDVSRLLEDDDLCFDFHPIDNEKCIREYDTNVMGRFICRNRSCHAGGWSSKKVPITIRMYRNDKYNARVYHQRCRACQSLSRPVLDDSYADRVAYRLKKWRGIQMEEPTFDRRSKAPHRKDLCEGCKAGHCKEVDFEE
ncbi:zinc-binding domain-containing protein [Thelonectria olida]|uniref:Zinc-binding domain-containing protein n=1 Tax=Thelonectria olida TaxID=1576542 RepID=A0A9P8VTY6_9HYPO|nr:zinc-binding domain-containing protein [Thelonectria olida]